MGSHSVVNNSYMKIKMKISTVSMFMMLSTCITWSQGRDISCQTTFCRTDMSRAEYCCSKKHTACCRYAGGGWNNGGNHVSEGSNGGSSNNGGNDGNGGSNNNNKPGSCPAYNGKRKRSAAQSKGYNSGFNGGSNNGGNYNGGH